MRPSLRPEWTLREHFGLEGLTTGLRQEVDAWYRRELEGDYRNRCIVALRMLGEHEVVVTHVVPKAMESGDPGDLDRWLFDTSLDQVIYASFKFTPTQPPPFGMVMTEDELGTS